jgi:Protein of unknown function (DUF1360)
MIKITDQYFWNVVFLFFFGFLVVMGIIILDTESRIPWADISLFDLVLITLASWRLMHFFSNDNSTKFLREQLYDLKATAKSFNLEKPKAGPRRTLIDLITSPWAFGLWMTSAVTFFYLLTAYALFPVIVLSISAVVAILQSVLMRFEIPSNSSTAD